MAERSASDTRAEIETVTSADGTQIALERTGSGPPLVLVHGAVSDRRSWDVLGVRSPLAEQFTVYALDRRGHGESGDGEPYAIERVFEDVAAVIEAIDGAVTLCGLSSGGLYALETARRVDDVHKAILYEPTVVIDEASEQAYLETMRLREDGNDEDALVAFLEGVANLLPEELELLRSNAYWEEQVALLDTVALEMGAITDYEFDPEQFANMTTPTLLFGGSESADSYKDGIALLDDALPNSRVVTIDGGGHIGLATEPEQFVDEVIAFG